MADGIDKLSDDIYAFAEGVDAAAAAAGSEVKASADRLASAFEGIIPLVSGALDKVAASVPPPAGPPAPPGPNIPLNEGYALAPEGAVQNSPQTTPSLGRGLAGDTVGVQALPTVLKVATSFQLLQQAIGPTVGLFGQLAGGLGEGIAKLAGFGGVFSAVKSASKADNAMEGAAGVVGVVGAVGGALEQLLGKLGGFVEALQPSTMLVFNDMLRNLTATVGQAFAPLFQTLAPAIMQAANLISPAMQALAPIVQKIADIFASALGPRVEFLSTLIQALLPVIQVLADVWGMMEQATRPILNIFIVLAQALGALVQIVVAALQPALEAFNVLMMLLQPALLGIQVVAMMLNAALQILLVPFQILSEVMKVFEGIISGVMDVFNAISDVLKILMTVFNTVVQTIMAFIKSLFAGMNLRSVFEGIINVIRKVTEAFLVFIAQLAMALGATDFVRNLINNLRPQGAVAAMQNVQIQGFEAIARDLATAAAGAQGTAGNRQEDQMNAVIARLERIQSGVEPLPGWGRFLQTIAQALSRLAQVPENFSNTAGGAAQAVFGPLAGAFFG
jgi:hypothetical protein